MKKHLLVLMALCFVMNACAVKNDMKDSETVTDEHIEYAVITIPESLFEEDANNLEAYVKENGFESAVLNDNKSVTVKMTEEKHKEILDAKSIATRNKLNSMVGGKDTPYITDIKYTDNFEEISVYVNRQQYDEAFLNMTTSTVGIIGMIYQVYTENINHVEVKIIDNKTEEEVETVVYPDALGE